jgi:AcrR family transcriptional regulator
MSEPRKYTKVARAEAELRTRTALLDAAERAFFKERFDDISLARVAAAEGVTMPTLLRHFGSKDGLTAAAFERAIARAGEERMSAPTDDIAGAVDNLLDHYATHGHRGLKLEAMGETGPAADMRRRGRELHYAWVAHAFGRWLAGPEREQRRAALIALCDVHTWDLLVNHLGMPRADVRATLTLSIRRLLGEAP